MPAPVVLTHKGYDKELLRLQQELVAFRFCDTAASPWRVVDADDQKAARLNVMSHLLSVLPYEHPSLAPIDLPQRQDRPYERPPTDSQAFVPQRWTTAHRVLPGD